MRTQSCDRETEMQQLARRDPEDPVLLAHSAECATCREARTVAIWMQRLAAMSDNTHDSMPADPHHLWWKAEMLRRWDAQRQATVPIEIGERAVVSLGLVAAVALLRWLWDGLPRLVLPSAPGVLGLPNLLMAVVIASGLVLAAAAFVAVRDLVDGN